MKKLISAVALALLSISASAQLVPMQVYNGMPFTIKLNSVAVREVSTCSGGTTVSMGIAIPPGGIYTVAPLIPGNPDIEWAGAKVSDLGASSYVRAIHPFFETCWLPSVSGGAVIMTGYWYPLGSSPYQVLKIY